MADYYSTRKRRFRAEQVPNYLRSPDEPRSVEHVVHRQNKDIPCANPNCISILQRDDTVVRRKTEDVEGNKRVAFFCSLVCEQDPSVDVMDEEY